MYLVKLMQMQEILKNWSTSLDKCYFEIDGKMINSVNYDKVVFGNTLNIREGE